MFISPQCLNISYSSHSNPTFSSRTPLNPILYYFIAPSSTTYLQEAPQTDSLNFNTLYISRVIHEALKLLESGHKTASAVRKQHPLSWGEESHQHELQSCTSPSTEFKAPALQPHRRLAAPSPLAPLPPSPPSWAYTMSGIRAGTELGT